MGGIIALNLNSHYPHIDSPRSELCVTISQSGDEKFRFKFPATYVPMTPISRFRPAGGTPLP